MPMFQVQGKCSLLVEADSFDQVTLKMDVLQGQDLWVLAPTYMIPSDDDSHTFVATCLELDIDIMEKRKS